MRMRDPRGAGAPAPRVQANVAGGHMADHRDAG